MLRGLISMCSLYQLFIETWHFIPEKKAGMWSLIATFNIFGRIHHTLE